MTETANKVHCSTIAEFNDMLGLDKPEHPLISVCFKDEMKTDQDELCAMGTPEGFTYSNDFYTIAIKKVVTGELHYGRTKYDFRNGTMMFTGPRQEITCSDVVCSTDVLLIAVHEDFLRGHPLWNTVRKYGFFSYAVNEALHLSPKEEALVRSIARNILDEYTDNPDEFSRELLLSQLDTLLKYANRYYKRQFINRAELSDAIVSQFDEAIRAYFDAGATVASTNTYPVHRDRLRRAGLESDFAALIDCALSEAAICAPGMPAACAAAAAARRLAM